MRFRAFQVCGDDNYLSSIESSSFGPPLEEERYASSSYFIIIQRHKYDFSSVFFFFWVGPFFFSVVFFLLSFGKGGTQTKGVKVSSPFGPKKKMKKKRSASSFFTRLFIYIYSDACVPPHE